MGTVTDQSGQIPSGSSNVGNSMYVDPAGKVWFRLGIGWPDVPLKQAGGTANQVQVIREVTAATTITKDDFTIIFLTPGTNQVLPVLPTGKIINLYNGSGDIITVTGSINGVSSTYNLNDKNNLQLQARDNLGTYIIL